MNTKLATSLLAITALLGSSSAWADSSNKTSRKNHNINPVSDCSELKNPELHSNICNGAQSFADNINKKVAQKILHHQFTTSGSKFTFYEHIPDEPHYTGQTPNPCMQAFKLPYGSKLNNPTNLKGGGTPLCNMLLFIESAQGEIPITIAETANGSNIHKQPITYFKSLVNSNKVNDQFGLQHGVFFTNVKKLGASAVSVYKKSFSTDELATKTNVVYYPDPNYQYNLKNAPKTVQKKYYGISGGGGSGAGFEIFAIYKNKSCIPKGATAEKKNELKVAIFTGGFGGGGGITSPEENIKLSAGAGGGGGMQFYSGLGLGAGTNHSAKTVQYSYNAGENLQSISKDNESILSHYLHHLERNIMQSNLNLTKACVDYITVEGGGGMGSGFELLDKTGEEYPLHAYSSEGGFQFKYKLKWAQPEATMIKRAASPTTVNPDLTPFYKAMGGYWAKLSQHKAMKKLKGICKGSWGSCPNCLFNLQNYSIFCKAQQEGTLTITNTSGKLGGIPTYMLISYPTGPKTQCTISIKPLDKKTTYSDFTSICKKINN
ncbi:MAG: hypothetical protein P1U63_10860 [Coxiellaceae bacterium]|nr:hypothetical protein [Coxiellaceae bacterium]